MMYRPKIINMILIIKIHKRINQKNRKIKYTLFYQKKMAKFSIPLK